MLALTRPELLVYTAYRHKLRRNWHCHAPTDLLPQGRDEYLLEIKFPDGKVGYVNVVGCCGIIENLYNGRISDNSEYVSTEPAQEILSSSLSD